MMLSMRQSGAGPLKRWSAGDAIVQSRLNGMVDGINRANALSVGNTSGSVLLAQTVAESSSYPAASTNPNVYPFRWCGLTDPADTRFTAAGRVSLSADTAVFGISGYVLNIAATSSDDPSNYIPENSLILLSPCNLGFWVTFYSVFRLDRFTLTSVFTSNTATANISEMSGTSAFTGVDLKDPEAVFDTLESGDTGLCVYQDGQWFAIQAPCPVTT